MIRHKSTLLHNVVSDYPYVNPLQRTKRVKEMDKELLFYKEHRKILKLSLFHTILPKYMFIIIFSHINSLIKVLIASEIIFPGS